MDRFPLYSIADFYRHTRILHVYISASLFALLALFSITGLLLNHPAWFEATPNSASTIGNMDNSAMPLLKGSTETTWEPDLKAILQEFQTRFHLGPAESVEWDRDYQEISMDFSSPGGYAQIYLNTLDGSYEILSGSGGWIEVMNDLHKGRHSGEVWKWVIDLSAIFILVFSLTGIIILFNNRRFRGLGFVLLLLGILTPAIIFWLCVPAISITN